MNYFASKKVIWKQKDEDTLRVENWVWSHKWNKLSTRAWGKIERWKTEIEEQRIKDNDFRTSKRR